MASPSTTTMTAAAGMKEEGNYKVVTFALDLTGKKLIDEICHIGAYHPEKGFSQYIMPYRPISQSSVRMHSIRIFTNYGRYRILKDLRTMKVLRTKSEYSTINEFIEWLKKLAEGKDGIILAYHDHTGNAVLPYLMAALERYKLTDEFFKTVKGFANCCTIGKERLENKDRSFALRSLLRRVLEFNEEKLSQTILDSAKKRAKFIYEIMAKMFNVEGEVSGNLVTKFVTGRDEEMANLEKQRVLAAKVKTLRIFFVNQIRKGPKERTRAVALRRYLIDAETDYNTLKSIYEKQSKDGIVAFVGTTAAKKKKQDAEDLVNVIVAHFSPAPAVKSDMNSNEIVSKQEVGAGEPMKDFASSTETDEDEFEEAEDRDVGPSESEI